MLRFLKIIAGDYKAKLFATVIASFLFFYVISDNVYKTTFEVPLNIVNLREGEVVVSSVPPAVDVVFEGNGRDLITLLIRLKYVLDVKFDLDLTTVPKDGVFNFDENLAQLIIPSNLAIQVLNVSSPKSLTIRTEPAVIKKIPVIADIEIDPAAGFVLVGDIGVRPDSIMVRLPETYADSIQYAEVEMTRHLDVDKDISIQIRLIPPKKPYISFEGEVVQVTADIQKLAETTIKNVPVKITNAPGIGRYSIEPSSLSLRVKGGVEVLAKLVPSQIEAVVDLQGREEDFTGLVPSITVPRDITWSELSPRRFKIVKKE